MISLQNEPSYSLSRDPNSRKAIYVASDDPTDIINHTEDGFTPKVAELQGKLLNAVSKGDSKMFYNSFVKLIRLMVAIGLCHSMSSN